MAGLSPQAAASPFASIKTGLSATFNVAGMQQSSLSGAQPQSISQRHTLVVTLLLLAAVVAWDAGGQDLAWAERLWNPLGLPFARALVFCK